MMAPFFMSKNKWILGSIVVLVASAGWFNLPILWALSVISILFYHEWKFRKTDKLIEHKEKVMGNRLIEGMKTLAELCGNAFDHIKDNKLKIDKANAKLGEHTARLHRLDQQKHRVDAGRNSQRGEQKGHRENEGIVRESPTPRESIKRTPRRDKEAPKPVSTPTDKPAQDIRQ